MKLSITSTVSVSIVLHALLIAYGHRRDATATSSSLKYTDIDYHVFNDAASYLTSDGGSPFDRATYRYTPLLAWILYPGQFMHAVWGKVIFSIFDIFVGCIIHKIVLFQKTNETVAVIAAAIWLLNPMTLVVSTRGNAESIIAFLVLATLYFAIKQRPMTTGLLLGIAVHFKIYPIIYAAPLYFSFADDSKPTVIKTFKSTVSGLLKPNSPRIQLTVASIIGFITPTFFCYRLYGQRYLDEAFIYHLKRSDVKHNFSPYFYVMYLISGSSYNNVTRWLSLIAFVPQAMAVVAIAIHYNNRCNLPFAMFLQTFAFVTFNKVCTSQYFLWYLCLLPTVQLRWRSIEISKMCTVIGAWLASQTAWLYAAYLLEFRGLDTFVYIWLASLCFLLSNVYVMDFFIHSY